MTLRAKPRTARRLQVVAVEDDGRCTEALSETVHEVLIYDEGDESENPAGISMSACGVALYLHGRDELCDAAVNCISCLGSIHDIDEVFMDVVGWARARARASRWRDDD